MLWRHSESRSVKKRRKNHGATPQFRESDEAMILYLDQPRFIDPRPCHRALEERRTSTRSLCQVKTFLSFPSLTCLARP